MDLEKQYKDSDGNECTIMQMVLRDPHWAANRIQAGEDAIRQLQNTSSNSDKLEKIREIATTAYPCYEMQLHEIIETCDEKESE